MGVTPKIDPKRTRKVVRRLLEGEYRDYLMKLPKNIEPKITSSFSLVPPNFKSMGNKSSTENIAIERIEYEEERNKFMSKIFDAVENLPSEEKYIITYRYLQHKRVSDHRLHMELNLSRSKYDRIKANAMLNLGYFLNLEVYVKCEEGKAVEVS